MSLGGIREWHIEYFLRFLPGTFINLQSNGFNFKPIFTLCRPNEKIIKE